MPHRLGLLVSFSWLVNQPRPRYPRRNKAALRSGLIVHWFPLIRPYQSLISEGGMLGGVGMLWPITLIGSMFIKFMDSKHECSSPQNCCRTGLQTCPIIDGEWFQPIASTPRKPSAIPQKKEQGLFYPGCYSFYWRGFGCFLWWEFKLATNQWIGLFNIKLGWTS